MTDKSDFVLKWEIDNATAKLATGKAESGVFNEGGFKWIASVRQNPTVREHGDITLICDSGYSEAWKCEAEVTMHVFKLYGTEIQYDELNFYPKEYSQKILKDISILSLFYRDKPIVSPCHLTVPNRRSDAILKVGEEKLHVSKELLALHSPVFEAMFFENFAEKEKEEVEIKDVVHQVVFNNSLNLYHLVLDSDRTVLHILKLADRFQMEIVMEQAKEHLTQSK
ncbi:hypothetical protein PENTCL1PPCAC_24251 [Pristionchus entomophagus]|uniref:BTB domain-containing protein n=1 Tax=Pristionchus entomophagus TaxID=358040 RepID=A0AAV5U6G6_9BILA|nr:hypothetical protein PENTCL1PPCAC_24251 [Pristionchus entomophagus]